MINFSCIKEIIVLPYDTFLDAYIDTCIIILQVDNTQKDYDVDTKKMGKKVHLSILKKSSRENI
jgi:hypothetical protein